MSAVSVGKLQYTCNHYVITMSTKSPSEMTLDELAKPQENIAESYTEKYNTVKNAFSNNKAVHVKGDWQKEGMYLYEDEGVIYTTFECEGKWQKIAYPDFSVASLQLQVTMTDEVEVMDLEDTRLYSNVYGWSKDEFDILEE